ncbi:NAD-glutamate dehydrogenase [Yimella sp. cx-51]|uniref:NAD-glutamate dehydrogenase n=1 Tax=Yimella sp. cx-51 TaxID=2770551 RepID=UPI00165D846B|nr:NAD-glutamate dehydrogenase [Yimella sp. cx-51]MBC9956684.1 NAD-glutamate dehydrogenase [Yimella sp. cx-51]MBD2759112.1 NAD-glutamate dehydrogenase [Yimella sp. cx-573]QTH38923.1 NAD-glutamate dehydrogenase [Yimella sp. cx-51]
MSGDPQDVSLRENASTDCVDGGCTEQLSERYFRHVAPEDRDAIGPANLHGLVHTHVELARHRPPGRANVQLIRPTSDVHGWNSSYAALQIVTDDMPFLVDSVTAALAARGRKVHMVIHPQIWVERDAAGTLVRALEVDEQPAGMSPTIESWMHLQIDLGADTSTDDELVKAVHGVLDDVRDAVADWEKMRTQCDVIIADLEANPPSSVRPDIIERTQAFLRWLADEHFTFLGYREYALDIVDGEDVLRGVSGTGLGLLRYDAPSSQAFSRLTPHARRTAREPHLITVTKANSRSTVHRPAHLDYIGLRTFDEQGNVIGERRFLGLFSSSAYLESVRRIPILRERTGAVIDASGYALDSHSGKDLLRILETYPRDELFQLRTEELQSVADQVLRVQERRIPYVLRRDDEFGRFASFMVYIPRDRYTTRVRLAMADILQRAFGAESIDYTTNVSDSELARIHFVVRFEPGPERPEVDDAKLRDDLLRSTQTWSEQLGMHAREEDGEDSSARVMSLYANAFPEAYKEDFGPRQGVADLRHIEALQDADDTRLTLYRDPTADPRERRFKLFRRNSVVLTDIMPIFTDLGVQVTDERPYSMNRADGELIHIYDFGLRAPSAQIWGSDEEVTSVRERFQDAFAAVWEKRGESDGLNALVLAGGLTSRQVTRLRALSRYLRQVGLPFSQEYVEQALVANVELTGELVALFEARFDPELAGDRAAEQAQINERIDEGLAQVASLDHDRILRTFRGAIMAILRTNAYQDDREVISFKIYCAAVPGMPHPRPKFEIWVYSPRVEGVHLRFGKVARGGLRWSDRREDFRTEVLGLVKAQMVKNAVIVPSGSKGGFYAKQLPSPSDRDAWMAEGIEAYKRFIGGMLDVTDNLVDGEVVPPTDVVRHDEDDTYLVVAADKGTASFSDIANGVATERGFWLADAFASGGSAGYDHKGMGITARGAWESVKRHFREMGHDTQTQDFTVVGIGDMSGDVFGNGMLLSEHIRLVAAFDHRHIFLDPDPEAAASHAERRRLFDLPRSSWDDYDRSLISEGGGVYPRTAKSVSITAQVRERLGLAAEVTEMTPSDLIHAILQAPVDLVWNGGIGTYIKAQSESNSSIGDRANDAIRVNGSQLRCKVVGEGGNLGASQLGRIEAASKGVRINTDAIDNSAGVDTSDHEVNIKILLTDLMKRGRFDLDERNEILVSMTDEVGRTVLRTNYEQNTLLGNARAQTSVMVTVHQRLIRWLESRQELDRALEFLPSDSEIDERLKADTGLTSPELAVLVAYAKLALKTDLASSKLTDDPWFSRTLVDYFPQQIRDRFAGELEDHPLKREIIVNSVANSLVNRGGITFAFRVVEETGASAEQIARAYVIAREVFDLSGFVAQVEALDNEISTDAQTKLYLEFRRLLDRAARWLINNRPTSLDITSEIERFSGTVAALTAQVPDLLRGSERERWERNRSALERDGVPTQLAGRAAGLLDVFSLLDVSELSIATKEEPSAVAGVYFAVSERVGIDTMLGAVSALPREDRWDSLARGAMRDDLYVVLESFTAAVLAGTPSDADPADRVAQWLEENPDSVGRALSGLDAIKALPHPSLAPLSVALRTLRGAIRSGSAS